MVVIIEKIIEITEVLVESSRIIEVLVDSTRTSLNQREHAHVLAEFDENLASPR
jgi:hypothetical protein